MRYLRFVQFVIVLVFLVPLGAVAQYPSPPGPTLEQLDASAEKIFSGRVVQIERVIAADASPAIVRVKFHVERAVRGCVAGDTVTVDEWAELWERGDRYRKGQQLVILLYPRSQTGFSSTIAGAVGGLNIGSDGLLRNAPLQADDSAAQATSSQPGTRPTHGEPDSNTRIRLRESHEQRKVLFDQVSE